MEEAELINTTQGGRSAGVGPAEVAENSAGQQLTQYGPLCSQFFFLDMWGNNQTVLRTYNC